MAAIVPHLRYSFHVIREVPARYRQFRRPWSPENTILCVVRRRNVSIANAEDDRFYDIYIILKIIILIVYCLNNNN